MAYHIKMPVHLCISPELFVTKKMRATFIPGHNVLSGVDYLFYSDSLFLAFSTMSSASIPVSWLLCIAVSYDGRIYEGQKVSFRPQIIALKTAVLHVS